MDRVLACLEVNQLAFLNICITAGCDYLPNVKGVGINKAKKLVKESDFLHRLIQIQLMLFFNIRPSLTLII
jgi:5'-3' exonuclease